MIRIDLDKWGQSHDDLRRLATESPHPRTRERFLALYMIAAGRANASSWARSIDRENETVIGWVRSYHERGPDAATYRKTGGSTPFFPPSRSKSSSTRSTRPNRSTTVCPVTAGP
jgi:hypothetical protein